MSDIKAGDGIWGPRWPEPMEVKLVEELGGYVCLVAATIGSGEHVDQLIPDDELAQLQIALVEASFPAPPCEVFLGLEACRYHFASLYDPLLAMNTSRIGILGELSSQRPVGDPFAEETLERTKGTPSTYRSTSACPRASGG